MIDDDCNVLGIIDWEFSTPLPFGMGFSRIQELAGEYCDKKLHIPANFEEAERGFWDEIFMGIPRDVHKQVVDHLEEVQLAVTLGILLDAFQIDGDQLGGYNPVGAEALPTLLSYRMPLIRGAASPYPEELDSEVGLEVS